jgi:uncharacterized protein
MIAVDTNILIYSHRSDLPQHTKATQALKALVEGRQAWAVPWPVLHEFYRVVTDRRIFINPTPPQKAFDQIAAWLESPTVSVIGESLEHFDVLQKLATHADIQGAAIHDARIAAICLSHSVEKLWTADRDFSYFPQLKTVNPLVM